MRSWLTFSLLLLAVILTACGAPSAPTLTPVLPTETVMPTNISTNTPFPGPTTTPAVMPQTIAANPSEQSSIRVVHAAPDSPAFNVYLELLAIATNLPFTAYTDETPITTGEYTIRILPSDGQLNETAVLQEIITVQPAHAVTVLITGTPDALTLSVVNQPLDPLSGSESRVTFVHAVPRGPDFSVMAGNVEVTPTLTFGRVSPPQIRIPGVTQFSLQSGGTSFMDTTISLRPNVAHTFVLVGRADDLSSLMLLDLPVQPPGKATVRVLNASTIPGIDLSLGSQMLGLSLVPGQSTERTGIVANQYDVTISQGSVSPLQTVTVNLLPDAVYTLVVAGSAENLRVFAQREDLSPTPSGESRVVFVNTNASSPIIRVQNVGGPLDGASDPRFGEPNTPIALSAGTYSLFAARVDNGEPGNVIARLENVVFEAGRSYLIAIPDEGTAVAVFSEGVGENAALVSSAEEVQPSPTPAAPTTVRFVNAYFDGIGIDFKVDDTTQAAAVSFGTGSDLITLPPGDHIFTAVVQGTGTGIVTEPLSIENGTATTIILYGKSGDLVKLMAVNDSDLIIDQLSPRLRLINLTTASNQAFSLGLADPTDPPLAGSSTLITTPNPEEVPGFIPLGVDRVGGSVAPGTVAPSISMPPGLRDLLLLDLQRNNVLGLVHSALLEPGNHYDMFTYVNPGSQAVTAFVVPYPS